MHTFYLKHLNSPYSFFEQKNIMDNNLSKHLNYIEDKLEEISFPKFVQSTLDNNIKQ